MASTEPLVCPHCLQLDRIQKASSIARDGTHTYYNRNHSRVTERTPLAQKLYLNFYEPTKNGYLLFMLAYTLILLAIAVFLFVTAFSSLHDPGDRPTKIVFLFLSAILTSLIGLYYPLRWFIQPDVMQAKWQQKQQEYEQRLERYKLVNAIYNEMYYCYRCDGVFIRGSNFIPIEEVAPFFDKGQVTMFYRHEDAPSQETSQDVPVSSWPSPDQYYDSD